MSSKQLLESYITQAKPCVFNVPAQQMGETVEDESVKCLIGASVYLGKGVPWLNYAELYDEIYVKQGLRVLRDDGVFVVIQTNAYADGLFTCRYNLLLRVLCPEWTLIDERVWMRRKADHFQVPFSHVLVFAKSRGGTTKRGDMNKRSKEWFQGVWDYPQTAGGELNAYPDAMCRMLVEATTDPGDLIVDPFAGSGRLLATAARMGRRAVGFEINTEEEHVQLMRQNGCYVMQAGDKYWKTLPPIKQGLVE